MSDEIKRRVVLASVLKPVDDTRMLEKIGAALASEGFEVFIIGYPTSTLPGIPGITFLPLPVFRRTSFKRLLIPWTVLKKINQVKPEVVIANTPELLLVMMISKLVFGRQVIYDILENYYRTIRYTQTYPPVVKTLLAIMVRSLEIVSSPFIDRFLLAEKGYAQELRFARNPVVLENKLPKKIAGQYPPKHANYHNLLFSGTLAPTTGVFEAIQLCKDLHTINPAYSLTIIGYASLPEVLKEIKQKIAEAPFINLIGGDQLVPHAEILQSIRIAGTGIVMYPHNPGTESSIPTKLYEYLALKLPVLISHTGQSHELVERCNAGIVLRSDADPAILDKQLANSRFTFEQAEDIYWESGSKKLLDALKA